MFFVFRGVCLGVCLGGFAVFGWVCVCVCFCFCFCGLVWVCGYFGGFGWFWVAWLGGVSSLNLFAGAGCFVVWVLGFMVFGYLDCVFVGLGYCLLFRVVCLLLV